MISQCFCRSFFDDLILQYIGPYLCWAPKRHQKWSHHDVIGLLQSKKCPFWPLIAIELQKWSDWKKWSDWRERSCSSSSLRKNILSKPYGHSFPQTLEDSPNIVDRRFLPELGGRWVLDYQVEFPLLIIFRVKIYFENASIFSSFSLHVWVCSTNAGHLGTLAEEL